MELTSVRRLPQAAPYLLPITRETLLTVLIGEQEGERGDEPAAGARKGTGSIAPRGRRLVARVALGLGADGKRIRRTQSLTTRREAQAWIEQQHAQTEELMLPVGDQRLDEYLRWSLEHEAPKGKPGRAPLATTTLESYRINDERHLIPAFRPQAGRVADHQ